MFKVQPRWWITASRFLSNRWFREIMGCTNSSPCITINICRHQWWIHILRHLQLPSTISRCHSFTTRTNHSHMITRIRCLKTSWSVLVTKISWSCKTSPYTLMLFKTKSKPLTVLKANNQLNSLKGGVKQLTKVWSLSLLQSRVSVIQQLHQARRLSTHSLNIRSWTLPIILHPPWVFICSYQSNNNSKRCKLTVSNNSNKSRLWWFKCKSHSSGRLIMCRRKLMISRKGLIQTIKRS